MIVILTRGSNVANDVSIDMAKWYVKWRDND